MSFAQALTLICVKTTKHFWRCFSCKNSLCLKYDNFNKLTMCIDQPLFVCSKDN